MFNTVVFETSISNIYIIELGLASGVAFAGAP